MPRQSPGALPALPVSSDVSTWARRCLSFPPQWREIIDGALGVLRFGYYYDYSVRDEAREVGEKIFYNWLLDEKCSDFCEVLLEAATYALSQPEPFIAFFSFLVNRAVECAGELPTLLYEVMMSAFVEFQQTGTTLLARQFGSEYQTIFNLSLTAEAQTLPPGADATAAFEGTNLVLGVPRGLPGPAGNDGEPGQPGQDCTPCNPTDVYDTFVVPPSATLTEGRICNAARQAVTRWLNIVVTACNERLIASQELSGWLNTVAPLLPVTVTGTALVALANATYTQSSAALQSAVNTIESIAFQDSFVRALYCGLKNATAVTKQNLFPVTDEFLAATSEPVRSLLWGTDSVLGFIPAWFPNTRLMFLSLFNTYTYEQSAECANVFVCPPPTGAPRYITSSGGTPMPLPPPDADGWVTITVSTSYLFVYVEPPNAARTVTIQSVSGTMCALGLRVLKKATHGSSSVEQIANSCTNAVTLLQGATVVGWGLRHPSAGRTLTVRFKFE